MSSEAHRTGIEELSRQKVLAFLFQNFKAFNLRFFLVRDRQKREGFRIAKPPNGLPHLIHRDLCELRVFLREGVLKEPKGAPP